MISPMIIQALRPKHPLPPRVLRPCREDLKIYDSATRLPAPQGRALGLGVSGFWGFGGLGFRGLGFLGFRVFGV